ncbi:MAG: hypothetical protein JKY34_13360 [Kordiimonadaceae bacterium]|nr:hypothetical protein [Kordiimonadaceae bacterium]
MKPAGKKYVRELLAALALYGAILVGLNLFHKNNEVSHGLTIVLALSPMVGVLVALRVMLTFIATMDELERRKIMEAILISFILVATGTFAYGFLEGVGFPKMETHMVFALLVGTMGLAQIYTAWKYK